MRVRSLGGEDPLEEGMAAHSSVLAWRIPWTEEAWWATIQSHEKLDMTEGPQQACTRIIAAAFSTLMTMYTVFLLNLIMRC